MKFLRSVLPAVARFFLVPLAALMLAAGTAAAAVDLVPTAVSATAASVVAGAALAITDTVRNQGASNMTAANIVVKYFLSADTAIKATDRLLGSRTIAKAALTAGASSTATKSFTVPASTPAGAYYIGVIVDARKTQAETSETNNTRASSTTIAITATPTLSACTAITPATPSVTLGSASPLLTATCSNSPTSYVWKVGATLGCTGQTCTVPAASLPTATTYGVTVTANNAGGAGTQAASATITVSEPYANGYTTPFKTSGANIVDAKGNVVELHGVNWTGFELIGSPNGLYANPNSVDYILDKIASLGFNLIRLPLSSVYIEDVTRVPAPGQYWDQANYPDVIQNNSYITGEQNPKPSMQVLDYVIQRAKAKNIYVLLDRHRASTAHQCGHWDTRYGYFKDDDDGSEHPCSDDGVTVTENQWINDWKALAARYNSSTYDNIIGAEIHNEPDHHVNWGAGDADDWSLAAARCGNAIQTAHSNWLIFVQGIGGGNAYGYNASGVKENIDNGVSYWWGGNLRGVKDFPVVLTVPNKVVYSIHEYGPGVYQQSWFSALDYPNNLDPMWDANWGYIAKGNLAPIFFSEFGGKLFDYSSTEGVWQNKLVDYMIKNNIRHYTYWELGPFSSDTEGLITDWQGLVVNQPKVDQIINRLMGQ